MSKEMSALVFWGLCGIALMLSTTLYGAFVKAPKYGQSPWQSVGEAWTNVFIGFSINFVANFFVFPLAGYAPPDAETNFWIGCIYTGISVLRSLIIRRTFNWFSR